MILDEFLEELIEKIKLPFTINMDSGFDISIIIYGIEMKIPEYELSICLNENNTVYKNIDFDINIFSFIYYKKSKSVYKHTLNLDNMYSELGNGNLENYINAYKRNKKLNQLGI